MTYFTGSSSASAEAKHWRFQYLLGAIFSSGACTSPVRSQCSSIRHIRKGNHEQFPSRKAARRLGWRSRMPPPQKLAAAIICSTGWQKTCRSMPFDPNCSPTWRSCDPAPSWKPTGTPSSSRVDHRHVYTLLVHGPQLHLARPAALLVGLEAYLVLGKAMASTALLVPHGDGIPAPRLPIRAYQAQVAHRFGEPTRRLVLELRVYVPLPQVWRLDDVHIAVQHLETLPRHGTPP